jgi:putative intracellular protease/amidase
MKTLAFLYPGCISFEILLACEILHPHFPVEVVTPDGRDHPASNGLVTRAAHPLVAVDPGHYKVALFPGGDPGALVGNAVLAEKVKELAGRGVILGAICAGPLILDLAGLLRGRRIAHGYEEPQLRFLEEKGFFRGVELSGDPLVSEGKIVTARPDSFIDFAVELGRLAGAIPEERVSFWRSYYRGNKI